MADLSVSDDEVAVDVKNRPMDAAGLAGVCEVLSSDSGVVNAYLARCGLDDDGAEALADALRRNRTLRKLYLGTNCVTGRGVAAICDALRGHAAIEHVNLSGNAIGHDGAAALVDLALAQDTLRTLVLDDCGLSSRSLALFGQLLTRRSDLAFLSLWNNALGATMREQLATDLQGHPSLASVDLPEPIVNTALLRTTEMNRG